MGGSTLASRRTPENDGLPYCKLNDETYRDLQQIAALKELPDKVCVSEREMRRIAENGASITESSNESAAAYYEQCRAMSGNEYAKCLCNARKGGWQMWNTTTNECECYFNDQSFDWNRLECVSDSENTANTIDKRIEPLTLYDTSQFGGIHGDEPFKAVKDFNDYMQKADSSNRLNACMTYGGKWDIKKDTCDCTGSEYFIECLKSAT